MSDEEADQLQAISSQSREEIIEQLDERGITVDSKDSTDRLKKKLIQAIKGKRTHETTIAATTSNLNATDMTMNSKIHLEFELGKDDWETFIERLELFFLVNNVSDDKKKQLCC
ncbi:hypothetical protein TKK_0011878 [Trichogramma kaykai]